MGSISPEKSRREGVRKIAERICTMPPELFWQILDGASIGQVLQLSAELSDPTDFDRCIAKQRTYKSVFPSPEHLANLRNTSIVLFRLRAALGFVIIPPGSPLSKTPQEIYNQKQRGHRVLRGNLVSWIRYMLHRQSELRTPDLQQYLETHYGYEWCHQDMLPSKIYYRHKEMARAARSHSWGYLIGLHHYTSLAHWAARISSLGDTLFDSTDIYRCTSVAQIGEFEVNWEPRYFPLEQQNGVSREEYAKYLKDAAERRWGHLTRASEQLSCMADLVETYPELLKMACDPLPVPRANWGHLVSGLRFKASRVHPSNTKPAACDPFFLYGLFPIVPSDDSLKVFVAGIVKLQQYLPAELSQISGCSLHRDAGQTSMSDNNADDKGEWLVKDFSTIGLSDTPFSTLCSKADRNLDPSIVLNDIRTAVKGMAFVHTLPHRDTATKPRVLRTRWTPWSTDPFRAQLLIAESSQQTTSSTESVNYTQHAPVFMSPPAPHLDSLSPEKLDKQCLHFYTMRTLSLHSPKEFEWIEAFCRTVRFLVRIEDGGNFAYPRAIDRLAQLDADFEQNQSH